MDFHKVLYDFKLNPAEKLDRITDLLVDGADPNVIYGHDKMRPLITCATFDASGKLLRVFLDFGADVNATHRYKWNALMECINGTRCEQKSGHVSLVVSQATIFTLIHYGADVNTCIKLPHSTTAGPGPHIIKMLLDAGANVVSESEYGGKTPLQHFVWKMGNKFLPDRYVECTMYLNMFIEAI